MKVLCNPLYGGMVEVMINLVHRYKINELYTIMFEDRLADIEKSELISHEKYRFLFLDMINGKYEKCIFYDDIVPLDVEILDKMSVFEPEILKMLERTSYTYKSGEKRFILYHRHLQYWNHFINKTNISFFISGLTPHSMYDYVIMRLCQIKGIPVLQLETMPFGITSRAIVHTEYEKYNYDIEQQVKEKIKSFKNGEGYKLVKDIQLEYERCINKEGRLMPIIIEEKHKIRGRLRYFKRLYVQDPIEAKKKIQSFFSRRFRTKKFVRYYNSIAEIPNLNVPYFYFAMHYQPELTTSPLGGWFVHQYLAIQMLSYCLPDGVWLYVKEHPAILHDVENTRDIEQYRIIKNLKNVKFVSFEIDSMRLIEGALAVSSITGSVGYESLYKHKPYIMFGNQIMRYAPFTRNVRTIDDCKKAVKDIVDGKVVGDDNDVKGFLAAIGEVTKIFVNDLHENKMGSDEETVRNVTQLFTDILDKYLLEGEHYVF